MIEKEAFKQILNYVLVVGLFVLAFLVLKPLLYSIIYGVLFAYLFFPVHNWLVKKIKSENASAFIVCFGVIGSVLIIFLAILGTLLKQIINFYLQLQVLNIGELIQKALPSFISNVEISSAVVNSINSSLSTLIANVATHLGNFVLDLPNISVQFLIMAFVFFFGLRDGERTIEYIKSTSPLKKETQTKFFKHFEDITMSVILGHIVVGIIQGIVAGIGYFLFGVPNVMILTIISVLVAVIPLVGPWLIWIPVDVYLFIIGRDGAGLGLLLYGLFLINTTELVLRPLIVSRRTQMNQAVVLIGMIGGTYMFGVLGLIIGPLVLAYVLLVIEVYRKHNVEENLIFQKAEA